MRTSKPIADPTLGSLTPEQLEAQADRILNTPRRGRKMSREYPWLSGRQRKARIDAEVLLSSVPGLEVSAYPGTNGLHICQQS
jgi:hypothetical protein